MTDAQSLTAPAIDWNDPMADPVTGASPVVRQVTLEQLRTASTQAPAPPIASEPTEAHDLAVQAALYARAVGYTRSRQVLDRTGNPVDITEDMPPDPGAAVKWLQARRAEQWGEKKTQEFRVIVARLGDAGPAISSVIEGSLAQEISQAAAE
jgi:hypothetical protein